MPATVVSAPYPQDGGSLVPESSPLLLTAVRCLERFNGGLVVADQDLSMLKEHAPHKGARLRIDDLAWYIIKRELRHDDRHANTASNGR
jgi:hypothetical protein